jgi:cytochrome c oxidase assembly protein subunit 11
MPLLKSDNPAPALNLRMMGKLIVIAVAMFGFGFAMIPIYRAICEITGVGLLTQRDAEAQAFVANTQVDTSRTITVVFDANSHGAWQFRPEKRSLQVHPGELVTVAYDLVNTQARSTVGQAIPSYLPSVAASSFKKLECFCFKQQALGPNESRRFPVVFVIDPKLPKDVGTITLSYAFFEIGSITEPKRSSLRDLIPPMLAGNLQIRPAKEKV